MSEDNAIYSAQYEGSQAPSQETLTLELSIRNSRGNTIEERCGGVRVELVLFVAELVNLSYPSLDFKLMELGIIKRCHELFMRFE